MYCRTCAKQLSDQAVICPQCGCTPLVGRTYCQKCNARTNENATMCVTCGAALLTETPLTRPKSKITAGLLGIFLGGFGIHRFYLGYTAIGVIQIVVTIITLGLGGVWGFIEGIVILAGAFDRDAHGRQLA